MSFLVIVVTDKQTDKQSNKPTPMKTWPPSLVEVIVHFRCVPRPCPFYFFDYSYNVSDICLTPNPFSGSPILPIYSRDSRFIFLWRATILPFHILCHVPCFTSVYHCPKYTLVMQLSLEAIGDNALEEEFLVIQPAWILLSISPLLSLSARFILRPKYMLLSTSSTTCEPISTMYGMVCLLLREFFPCSFSTLLSYFLLPDRLSIPLFLGDPPLWVQRHQQISGCLISYRV